MVSVGVCYFDDPDIAGSGWTSVAGAEPARVNGYIGLSPDVLWVTNLSFNQYRNLNLGKTPHIFDSQYFRASVQNLSAELGLAGDPENACAVLSEAFTRAMRIGEQKFSLPEHERGYRYASMISSSLTPAPQRRRPDEVFSHDLEIAIQQSTQHNQASFAARAPSNTRAVAFAFPRGTYARWLLGQPMPTAKNWKTLTARDAATEFGTENGKIIKGTASTLERLEELNKKHAGFLRVSVVSMDPFHAQFAQFGNGAPSQRGWATIPEVISLARYARVKMQHGYLCDIDRSPWEEKVKIEGGEYSFSRGVFLENLWAGLSMPLHGSKRVTPLAAYLRAYDRICCTLVAEEFERHSYSVGSFSTGRIVVYVREGESQGAVELALNNGLIPPIDLLR